MPCKTCRPDYREIVMDTKITLLYTEKQINSLLWGSFTFLFVTGFWNWFIDTHTIFSQWTSIFHALAGFLFLFAVVLFGYIHFRRTLGLRRPLVLTIGVLAWLIFLVCAYTGIHILIFGRQEAENYIHIIHQISAVLSASLLLTHLLIHNLYLPEKRVAQGRYISLDNSVFKRSAYIACTLFALLLTSSLLSLAYDPDFSTDPYAINYEYSYGDHPFRPSQTETHNGKFVDNRQISNSSECTACHADIANQWIDSTHKKAAADPTYVRNINLLADKKGISATRYCEGCHAPVALLTGALSPGGYHGGQSGTDANREGVNCMSCHGINKLEHLKGVASYHFKPVTPYLFEGSSSEALRSINRLSIKLNPEQHKKELGNKIISTPEFCASCHAQFMDKDMNNWGWVKMQDDYSSWLDSPFSGRNPRFSSTEPVPCQTCHMPPVKSNDPSADSSGTVRSHRFAAANTLLALMSEDSTQYDETVRFLQANKITLTIKEPHRKDASQTYFHLEHGIRDRTNLPWYFYLGEDVVLSLSVNNVGVGHGFPGGTIDINEAWVDIVITDAQGKVVFSSGQMNEHGEVDADAYFYRSIPVDRSGKHVWRHDLFNMIGESYRNVIPPGGSDIVSYEFNVPSWAISPLTVSAAVKYRKLNKRYSNWALETDKVDIPVIDVARSQLIIPIKLQPEVHKPQNVVPDSNTPS